MKLSHTELTGQRDPQNDVSRREKGIVSRCATRCAIIGALAFASPLLSGTALAQQPNPAPPETNQPTVAVPTAQPPVAVPSSVPSTSAAPEHRVRGETTSLTDGSTSISAYIVIRGSQTPSTIEVEGPARVTLLFYPVVSRDRFTAPDAQVQRSIGYSLGPATGGAPTASTYDGSTRMSAFTNRDVDQSALAIGTPIEMTINVAAGRQALTFPDMNGFFQVVRVQPPAPPRPIQPAQPVARPVQPVAPVATPQGDEHSEPLIHRRPLAMFEGGMFPLHSIGSAGNSGTMYEGLVQGTIPVTDRFGIVVGGLVSSTGLTLQMPNAETSLRGYLAALGAGVSFREGRHYAYALGYGGYNGITTHVYSFADGRTLDDWAHEFGYGGMGGYEYGRYFALRVQGGNNPFNPLSAHAFGALPYTWTPGVYPSIDVNFLWLHALAPVDTPNMVGLTRLNENAFNIRILGTVPTYRLGPVVPTIVGGGEFNVAGGSVTSGTGIIGGGLRTDFVPGLDIDAIGAATFRGEPLVFLRVGYSR